MAGRHDETAPRPRRRSDLSVHEIDGEAVAFDPSSGAVHRFNETALLVWRACDGTRGVEAIADELGDRLGLGPEESVVEVGRTVDLIKRCGLLDGDSCAAGGAASVPSAARSRTAEGTGDEMNQDATEVIRAATVKVQKGPRDDDGLGARSHHVAFGRADCARHSARLVSRRDLLRSSATRAVLAAPIVSTFFASGAYASGPSASAAFGAGGCKTIGYSCTTIADCCVTAQKGKCQSSTCCLNTDETGCDSDADCCDANTCVAGTCQ